MRASHTWLRELSGLDATAAEMAERLTRAGIEVEGVHAFARGLEGVVVAEVRASRPHPGRPGQSIVTVFDGAAEREVVCGAPNVPTPGGRVLYATLGTTLPGGLTIAPRAIGGVTSYGMLCSEAELGIGADGDGIVVLGAEDAAPVGAPFASALGLHDEILEISLTPNRPDCLGHVGLARELCALYAAPFALPRRDPGLRLRPETAGGTLGGGAASVAVDAGDRCGRYAAVLVRGVSVRPSPLRVRARLWSLGVRAISSVVDATNLVVFEHGYPTHAFDRERLAEGRVIVRRARDGETARTLDGATRTLTADDLLICDAEGAVAVAGVMGCEGSGVRASTRDVLLEIAWFEPRGVRRTARRLGLHTDASHRFERGVDPGAVPEVAASLASWVLRLAGGVVEPEGIDVHPGTPPRREIALRLPRARALLGDAAITADSAEAILASLGCDVVGRDGGPEGGLRVRAPSWRPDLLREVDLVEELARVRGLDRIPTVVPEVRPSAEGTPARTRFSRRLREAAAASGLLQAIDYAFVSPQALAAARVSTDAVPLVNPLSEERSVLRTSLLPGLLAALSRAQRHQVARVALFELASVFAPARPGADLPDQREQLALVLSGPRASFVGDLGALDFYDAKGAVASVLALGAALELETTVDDRLPHDAPFLHPRRCARVIVPTTGARTGAAPGAAVGVLGEVHPDVARALDLQGRPVYAELDVDALFAVSLGTPPARARALPRFPAVTRDVAVVVAEGVFAGEVGAALREAAGPLCERVECFDVYRGAGIAEGHKSLAFRVTYRDPDATLTDKRVDQVHAAVVRAAEERFGARLRS
jgi:phenylalanyl-tRNA synthetase beta chain